jgi:hypothetical protein
MKNTKIKKFSTIFFLFIAICVDFGYNYYGSKINEKVFCNQFSFRSKEIAEKAVDEIIRRSGLKQNFYVIECPNTDNCFAAIQGQNRLIVYDGSFMKKANDLSKSDWGALSILAHEIGHHLQGHTIIEGGSDPSKELEADEFSGFVMYQMGASLKEAQAAINQLTSDYDDGTHPARPKRLAAIKKGYENAQELYPNIKKNNNSTTQPLDKQVNVGKVNESADNGKETIKKPTTKVESLSNVENLTINLNKFGCIDGNCVNGFGKMINPKTEERYEGEWKNSKRDGKGVEFYANGEKKYVGSFKNGRYEGNGSFFHKNGDKYVGKYKNGLMNDDKGYFIYNNNIRLVLRIENNIKHGKATRIYPDGRRENTFFVNNIEKRNYVSDKKQEK